MSELIEDVVEKAFCDDIESFVVHEITPNAQSFDQNQAIPRTFFKKLASVGVLGACIPKQYGGHDLPYQTICHMHEALGGGLGSIENIATVNGMVARSLIKYGTEMQRTTWLPRIACGEALVAIALTEQNIGSDIKNIEMTATLDQQHFILNGVKKYITLGQIADLFLVLAKHHDQHVTFLVERDTPGIRIKPIQDLSGFRANMLAELHFTDCRIPTTQMLGQLGHGLRLVIMTALDEGRFTTACGCVGLANACVDGARSYAKTRIQYGQYLNDHQLIQRKLSHAISQLKAAQQLVRHTARLRDNKAMHAFTETFVAKYFCANMVVDVSDQMLSIFGAAGVTKQHAIERHYRDARMMQIVEGTPEMYEINIVKLCM